MKAAVFTAPEKIEFQNNFPDPKLHDGLLLEVKACGVCGTDVKALKGNHPSLQPPMVLGHEFAGVVLESHLAEFKVGDRVAAAPYAGCGYCQYCLSEHEELCRNKVFISGGGFAERISVPALLARKTAWKIPDDVSWEEAAMAEPLSCAILSMLTCRWQPGWSIMIVGAGFMGLLHLLIAKTWSASKILVSEPNKKRRETAEGLGAIVLDPANDEDACKWAAKQTNGFGPNVVIVAVGNAKVAESAIDCSARGGVVHLFGGLPKDAMLSVSAYTIHYKEVSLIGTSGFRSKDYRLAVEMIKNHSVSLKQLISARLPLEKTGEAIKISSDLDTLKVMVMP